jgi:hypothetical protein
MSEALDKLEALADAYLNDFLDVEEVSPKQEQMLFTAGMIAEFAASILIGVMYGPQGTADISPDISYRWVGANFKFVGISQHAIRSVSSGHPRDP